MEQRLVEVGVFFDSVHANIAKSRLESEGIQACLSGEATADTLWHVGTAIGGVKLLVWEDQAIKAREILDACEPQDDDAIDDHDVYDEEDEDEEASRSAAEHEDSSPPRDEREAKLRRAWVAAVLGVWLCPPLLSTYSMFQLIAGGLLERSPPIRGHWRATAALVINLMVIGATIVVSWWLFLGGDR